MVWLSWLTSSWAINWCWDWCLTWLAKWPRPSWACWKAKSAWLMFRRAASTCPCKSWICTWKACHSASAWARSLMTCANSVLAASYSWLRASMELVCCLRRPPVIEPPGMRTSPSRVTILTWCLRALARLWAASIRSQTKVVPSKLATIIWFTGSYSTKSEARPIKPAVWLAVWICPAPRWRAFMLARGRKVARPAWACLR